MVRFTSFHQETIIGKIRVPRKLKPIDKKHKEIEKKTIVLLNNEPEEGSKEEQLNSKSAQKGNFESFIETPMVEDKEDKKGKDKRKKEEKKVMKKVLEFYKDLVANTESELVAMTDLGELIVHSLNITIKGIEKSYDIPIQHLKYVVFNRVDMIQGIIVQSLRVDKEIRWFLSKCEGISQYKSISENYPHQVITKIENKPATTLKKIKRMTFETKFTKSPYSYTSCMVHKGEIRLPFISLKTKESEKIVPLSLGMLKYILKHIKNWEHLALNYINSSKL
ncbi:hypothetical protein SteCoe_36849 [Stentor coeruleus]|uniref:Uncharacterized protein n=1 Tax=Stentor coeruleus TaxID=5963 RepID=A0A1R2AP78_9CILI|nr:hypothetical protein SteCoe_36849 [Stentor coeruleus]